MITVARKPYIEFNQSLSIKWLPREQKSNQLKNYTLSIWHFFYCFFSAIVFLGVLHHRLFKIIDIKRKAEDGFHDNREGDTLSLIKAFQNISSLRNTKKITSEKYYELIEEMDLKKNNYSIDFLINLLFSFSDFNFEGYYTGSCKKCIRNKNSDIVYKHRKFTEGIFVIEGNKISSNYCLQTHLQKFI